VDIHPGPSATDESIVVNRRPPPPPPSRRPPPLPPSEPLAVPAPKPTRLFTQGVQAAVRPPMMDGEDSRGALPFSDLSTQTLTSYINESLSETPTPEPSAAPTKVDTEPLADLEYVPPGLLFKLTPLAKVLVPPLLASAATLAACWFLWGRQARPPVTLAITPPAAAAIAPAAPAAPAAPEAPASAEAASPSPPPATEPVPAPAPAPGAASAPAPETAVPAGGRCAARITSRPPGAAVTLGSRALGKTPLQLRDLPCDGATITLSRARYVPARATLPAAPGAAPLLVRLERPPAELALTSTPEGARFSVDRKVVAAGTRAVAVKRFEKVRIRATLPGHRPWEKVVYVTGANQEVRATLKPGR
jgi:hypothetical protein